MTSLLEEFQRQISFPLLFASEPTALYSSTTTTGSSKCKFNGTCDHWHVQGHKHKNYYKLIGFPPNFKFTRKKSVATNVTSSIDSVEPVIPSSVQAPSTPTLTSKQYQQLLTILQKDSSVYATAHMAGPLQWIDVGDW
ncbi:hypothetical protein J1N35_028674 [Gossypium stocksii]|uniref:Uncharacterized protein n=1 Tax=Gossypium stocksii TaxID=47602 RepID=A0A9D3UWR2_9ROSI|nr:hypothetical protein J1N35_028674 [Gossypium stocksii]